MNQEQAALVERWKKFLASIHQRLDELCVEAEGGVKAIAAQHPNDFLPIGNALTGLDHRVRQLRDRIDQVWSEQVEEKFEEASGDGLLDVGLDLKQDAEIAFDERWSGAKIRWLADLAREAWPAAAAAMEEPVHCTNCGGPLELATRIEVVAASCGHCQTVNQVGPPPAVQTYFYHGVDHLAEEAALPLRHAVERQRVEADRWRRARDWAPEPVESFERWEQMERAYWQRFAEEKARLLGKPVDQAFVESRMNILYDDLEREQVWVRAKGKRAR